MLSRPNIPSGTAMPDFPVHHSPGNWRPIIRETDSSSVSASSENVSSKGTKFEEDPRTYSLKASRIVSRTFGDNNDAKWSNRFFDRELFVKDLPGWCKYHGRGGVYAHDTIRPAICEKIPTQCRMMQPRNWERLRIFVILVRKILVMYASSLLRIFQ